MERDWLVISIAEGKMISCAMMVILLTPQEIASESERKVETVADWREG